MWHNWVSNKSLLTRHWDIFDSFDWFFYSFRIWIKIRGRLHKPQQRISWRLLQTERWLVLCFGFGIKIEIITWVFNSACNKRCWWQFFGDMFWLFDRSLYHFHLASTKTVTVLLVTLLCWWLYDGDWFEMLMAFLLYWWFLNELNRSPTSQTCHKHLKLVTNTSGLKYSSPTSM